MIAKRHVRAVHEAAKCRDIGEGKALIMEQVYADEKLYRRALTEEANRARGLALGSSPRTGEVCPCRK
jgi:hypothetical protein